MINPPDDLTAAPAGKEPVADATEPVASAVQGTAAAITTVAGAPPAASPAPQPTLPTPAADEDEAAAPSLARRLGLTVFAAVALCCGSIAVLSASAGSIRELAFLGRLAVPLSAVGLLFSFLGLMACVALERGRLAWPAGAAAFNALILVVTAVWPGLLGGRLQETWRERSPFEGKVLKVPVTPGRREAPTVVEESEWVDASSAALELDGARVRVRSVAVRGVETKTTEEARPAREKFLIVEVRVQNLATMRQIGFQSWMTPPANPETPQAVVRAPQGKEYRIRPDKAAHAPVALAPTKAAEDILMFEPPPANVDYLRLELPAAAFGGEGRLRFLLPKSMIVYR